jgi:CelD/BcsL family acetyltransferase involved in cellulose biosynthesis
VAPTAAVQPAFFALDDPDWRAFVQGCEGATPFHHPAWASVLVRTYGYRGFALAVCDENDRPVAGAPFLEVRGLSRRRRWISLPFTDECPPLASHAEAARALAEAVPAAQDRARGPSIEVRAPMYALGWRTGAEAVDHVLGLDRDVARVREGFSRSQVVRNITRAEREGVVVRRAAGRADLDAFYALHTRTRRRQGVPVQPRRFFDELWTHVVEPGLGTILLADAGGATAVAGALFLAWNGTTIYKFGASDPAAWPHRPNHLIFWTAIQDACARGDTRFDFGRTDLGNPGLRAFKRGWGAWERPLAYSSLELGAATGAEGLATRALSVAIRRGPAWLCRGVGETLYRHAAAR